jgi:hypothetical protein
MSQTVRELLTELAWIEDSIRYVPLNGEPFADTEGSLTTSPVNPDLVALAEREREIIAELRQHGSPAAN